MERIVVGVDGSETSKAALAWALDEARRRKAAVDVVHTWYMPWSIGYHYAADVPYEAVEENARRLLATMVDEADTSDVASVEQILRSDGPARVLLEIAKGADLLVVGSRGLGGFTGLLMGSVSAQVVHHAPCPVVVIPPAGTER